MIEEFEFEPLSKEEVKSLEKNWKEKVSKIFNTLDKQLWT